MKTSSKFILKSFAGPFVATFFIAIFILLMQFLWKHIDDMVGKGLAWHVIARLLFYISASLVPLALPLATLLSSLMTFGNLGEHYELVAFKSAGVSLRRVLRPMAVAVLFLSITAFLFSNYWLPVANLKSRSLLYDVSKQKPTMDIKPGIFANQMDNFTIRVSEKKTIDKIDHLYNVMIYDHSNNQGNRTVITAEEGIMQLSEDGRYLTLELFRGQSYNEPIEKKRNNLREFPMARYSFEKDLFRFDLSEFDLNRTDEDLFKSNYRMLNLKQLQKSIDTLIEIREDRFGNYIKGLNESYLYFAPLGEKPEVAKIMQRQLAFDSIMTVISPQQQAQVITTATNLARNSKSRVTSMREDLRFRNEYIRRHQIEWHKKLTLSFACIILFLIGAPLGAIIRKGGIGMPMVISVIFFLIFHVFSITGEKMAREGAIPIVQGMWMASMVLLPIGLFFTYKATTDSSFFRLDTYLEGFKRFFRRKKEQDANITQ